MDINFIREGEGLGQVRYFEEASTVDLWVDLLTEFGLRRLKIDLELPPVFCYNFNVVWDLLDVVLGVPFGPILWLEYWVPIALADHAQRHVEIVIYELWRLPLQFLEAQWNFKNEQKSVIGDNQLHFRLHHEVFKLLILRWIQIDLQIKIVLQCYLFILQIH